MTSTDRKEPDDDGTRQLGRIVDHLLGEGDVVERATFRDALAWDLDLAIEVGETRAMFDAMRSLEIEPSGRVERDLRRIVGHRARLRSGSRGTGSGRLGTALRVAAVAVISLGVGIGLFGECGLLRDVLPSQLLPHGSGPNDARSGPARALAMVARIEIPALGADGSRARPDFGADPELAELLDVDHVPVAASSFRDNLARLVERPIPDDFVGLLSAENLLAQLRAESELRFSAEARRRARLATGTPDLEDRIDSLASVVAARVAGGVGDPEDLAFALRALVASGSSSDRGPNQATVRTLRDRLVQALPGLDGGSRATLLAALADLAVVGDDGLAGLVATAADQLARETLRGGKDAPRPALLNWLTPVSRLADAGRLLVIAPAFGTHSGLAFRARLSIAAHLGERVDARSGSEQPALAAARLYGFGDLIERRETERQLALWRLSSLATDPVTVHHIAWSQYPVRPGWATFQRELRGLAGVATPAGVREAASLLLALCTNVAAPGVRERIGDTSM